MRFQLIDDILERSDDRIVAVKQVTGAEEYLADHFPTFPILPGVFMLETMVQAARALLDQQSGPRIVLGQVRAFKYGAMVRPGEGLIVEITAKSGEDGSFTCKGTGTVRRQDANSGASGQAKETACSGRFTMRPVRMA